MSTPISAGAASARETSRTQTGQFGEQHRAEDTTFTPPTGAELAQLGHDTLARMVDNTDLNRFPHPVDTFPSYDDERFTPKAIEMGYVIQDANTDGNGDGWGFQIHRVADANGLAVDGVEIGIETRVGDEFLVVSRRYEDSELTTDPQALNGRASAAATCVGLQDLRNDLIESAKKAGLKPGNIDGAAPITNDRHPEVVHADKVVAALDQYTALGLSWDEYPPFESEDDANYPVDVASAINNANVGGRGDGYPFSATKVMEKWDGDFEGYTFDLTADTPSGKKVFLSSDVVPYADTHDGSDAEGREAVEIVTVKLLAVRDELVAQAKELGLKPIYPPKN